MEVLNRPTPATARSWCVSTAVSRLFGLGRYLGLWTGSVPIFWSLKISSYQPSGQASCYARRAALAASQVALLMSKGAVVWSKLAAFLAIASAQSLLVPLQTCAWFQLTGIDSDSALNKWRWFQFRFQQSMAMWNRFRFRFRSTRKDWFRLRTFGSGIDSVLIPYGGVHDTPTHKKTSKVWINARWCEQGGGGGRRRPRPGREARPRDPGRQREARRSAGASAGPAVRVHLLPEQGRAHRAPSRENAHHHPVVQPFSWGVDLGYPFCYINFMKLPSSSHSRLLLRLTGVIGPQRRERVPFEKGGRPINSQLQVIMENANEPAQGQRKITITLLYVTSGNRHCCKIVHSCKKITPAERIRGKRATLGHLGPESVFHWRNRFRFRLWLSVIDSDSDSGVKF